MTAQQAMYQAIAAADAGASETWKVAALQLIVSVCREKGVGQTLTTDDLWLRLDGTAQTRERRAMGPVMIAAARLGLIRRTGAYVSSNREACNARPVAIWEIVWFPEGVTP